MNDSTPRQLVLATDPMMIPVDTGMQHGPALAELITLPSQEKLWLDNLSTAVRDARNYREMRRDPEFRWSPSVADAHDSWRDHCEGMCRRLGVDDGRIALAKCDETFAPSISGGAQDADEPDAVITTGRFDASMPSFGYTTTDHDDIHTVCGSCGCGPCVCPQPEPDEADGHAYTITVDFTFWALSAREAKDRIEQLLSSLMPAHESDPCEVLVSIDEDGVTEHAAGDFWVRS